MSNNPIEKIAENWLTATGNNLEDTVGHTLLSLGQLIITQMQPDGAYYIEIKDKKGITKIFTYEPDYDELRESIDKGFAEIQTTSAEGTCQLVLMFQCLEFVILADNTVITRYEDNVSGTSEAFFPYETGE